jgi:hypothetical protein
MENFTSIVQDKTSTTLQGIEENITEMNINEPENFNSILQAKTSFALKRIQNNIIDKVIEESVKASNEGKYKVRIEYEELPNAFTRHGVISTLEARKLEVASMYRTSMIILIKDPVLIKKADEVNSFDVEFFFNTTEKTLKKAAENGDNYRSVPLSARHCEALPMIERILKERAYPHYLIEEKHGYTNILFDWSNNWSPTTTL